MGILEKKCCLIGSQGSDYPWTPIDFTDGGQLFLQFDLYHCRVSLLNPLQVGKGVQFVHRSSCVENE